MLEVLHMLRKVFLKIWLEKNAHCPFCLTRAIGASNIILLTIANNSKVMCTFSHNCICCHYFLSIPVQSTMDSSLLFPKACCISSSVKLPNTFHIFKGKTVQKGAFNTLLTKIEKMKELSWTVISVQCLLSASKKRFSFQLQLLFMQNRWEGKTAFFCYDQLFHFTVSLEHG